MKTFLFTIILFFSFSAFAGPGDTKAEAINLGAQGTCYYRAGDDYVLCTQPTQIRKLHFPQEAIQDLDCDVSSHTLNQECEAVIDKWYKADGVSKDTETCEYIHWRWWGQIRWRTGQPGQPGLAWWHEESYDAEEIACDPSHNHDTSTCEFY